MKTLHYSGKQIHDFAWFADKMYRVRRGKVILPNSGREVKTMVMFTRQEELWENAIDYVNDAIMQFSSWIGDYPYDSFTAVQAALAAGSGMEYPGLTVIGMADDAYSLDEVIAHEACHSWFYSAVGSDERRFPFLDEGITTAYDMRYMQEKYPGKKLWEVYLKNPKLARLFKVDQLPVERMSELEWLSIARNNLEQPLDLAAEEYNSQNYSNLIYYKAGMGFNYLRKYLGDAIYDTIMNEYYSKWKSKHPYPSDLRKVFESNTEKDLNWFFNDFLSTTKTIDYKIRRADGEKVLVRNKGEMAPPFSFTVTSDTSMINEWWSDGFNGEEWINFPEEKFSDIKINSQHSMPEINQLNNNWSETSLFRKADPLRTVFLFTIEEPDKRYLLIAPLVNLTRVDGFMPGIALSNGLLLTKPFEYLVMPFYSFRNTHLTGKGRININIIPANSFIRKSTISLEGLQFGASASQKYKMIKTSLDIHFKNNNIHSGNQMVFASFIAASDLYRIGSPDLEESTGEIEMTNFWKTGYLFENKKAINPFSFLASLELNESYQKLSLEYNYRYSYYGRGKGLDLRLFSGTMLQDDTGDSYFGLAPSGRNGRELYMFDGDFPDRLSAFSTTFWSRQMLISEGGLVTHINDSSGFSPWLLSTSLSSNLPGRTGLIPLKPF
jgi:hypothetical protein